MYCAAKDIFLSTGSSSPSVKTPNRPRSLARKRNICFQDGNLDFRLSNKGMSLNYLTSFSLFLSLRTGTVPLSPFLQFLEAELGGFSGDSLLYLLMEIVVPLGMAMGSLPGVRPQL